MSDIRNDCLNLLMAISEEGRPSHIVLAEYLDSHAELPASDRSFAKRLTQGVIERRLTIDHIINSFSKTHTDRMKPVIRNLLRMSVYQILYMDVQDFAACNEAVRLVKKRGISNLSGFVNGVLRNIVRNRDGLTDFADIEDVSRRLSLEYSMPAWIVDYFLEHYGTDAAVRAFSYFLEDSRTCIRCNISRISPNELESVLTGRGIRVEHTVLDKCMCISDYGRLAELEEFNRGLFAIQDLSSVLAGEAATVKQGDRVLDLCAAPGGKSMNLADRLLKAGGGSVVACDISEQKTSLIKDNVTRSGFGDAIRTMLNDATVFNPEFLEGFETVICDVPCSGLGIIGRKPDIKYNMSVEAQQELAELAERIVDNAVRYVAEGGQLLYSTCTVNHRENEDMVAYIEKKGFTCTCTRQLLPGEEGCDGFFYARLVKTGR